MKNGPSWHRLLQPLASFRVPPLIALFCQPLLFVQFGMNYHYKNNNNSTTSPDDDAQQLEIKRATTWSTANACIAGFLMVSWQFRRTVHQSLQKYCTQDRRHHRERLVRQSLLSLPDIMVDVLLALVLWEREWVALGTMLVFSVCLGTYIMVQTPWRHMGQRLVRQGVVRKGAERDEETSTLYQVDLCTL